MRTKSARLIKPDGSSLTAPLLIPVESSPNDRRILRRGDARETNRRLMSVDEKPRGNVQAAGGHD